MQPAVFLDRDGTLIEEAGYLDRIERLVFFPYSVDAVRLLNRAGLAVVIVTNQAGVARGIFPESFVAEAHAHLRDRLAAGGARVDAIYYCPHHPDGTVDGYRRACECRKPGDGMLRSAAVLVRTGYGRTEEQRPKPGVSADVVVDNLIEAVSWIVGQPR